MIKKLTKHGNSLALIIDKPILELLNIKEDTELEISTDGRSLIIRPSNGLDRKRKFDHAFNRVVTKYRKTFEELAK